MSKKYLFIIGILLFLVVTKLLAQNSGVPSNLRVRTDANNYLLLSAVAQTNPISQPNVFTNTRLRIDSSNNLLVVLTGSVTPTFPLLAPVGCTTIPYSFTGRITTGICSSAANTLDFYTNNIDQLSISTTLITASLPLTVSGNIIGVNFQLSSSNGILTIGSRGSLGATANGLFQFLTTAGTSGVDLDVITNDGIAWFKTRANTDLAAVKANQIISTGAFISGGSGMLVANVGANSCGTTAAAIAGNSNAFVITVGATSGNQCRVAFPTAATTEWDCTVTDSTTTIATRATPVDTTHTDFLGVFVAGDKVTGICFAR